MAVDIHSRASEYQQFRQAVGEYFNSRGPDSLVKAILAKEIAVLGVVDEDTFHHGILVQKDAPVTLTTSPLKEKAFGKPIMIESNGTKKPLYIDPSVEGLIRVVDVNHLLQRHESPNLAGMAAGLDDMLVDGVDALPDHTADEFMCGFQHHVEILRSAKGMNSSSRVYTLLRQKVMNLLSDMDSPVSKLVLDELCGTSPDSKIVFGERKGLAPYRLVPRQYKISRRDEMDVLEPWFKVVAEGDFIQVYIHRDVKLLLDVKSIKEVEDNPLLKVLQGRAAWVV